MMKKCFDRKDFDDIDEEFLCAVCGNVMNDPVQLPCGHDCGLACVATISPDKFSCAAQDCLFVGSGLPLRNQKVGRLISKLSVRCTLQCGWRGQCAALYSHDCANEQVNCPFRCGEVVARKSLALHKQICELRQESCPHCFRSFKASDLPMHVEEKCPVKEVTCSQCNEKVRRGELPSHVQSICTKAAVPCPFAEYGCPAVVSRCDVERHVTSSLEDHCRVLIALIQRERVASREELDRLRTRLEVVEGELKGKSEIGGKPLHEVFQDFEDRILEQQKLLSKFNRGSVLTVDVSGACGMFSKISDAVANCREGDTILLRPGVYNESVEIPRDFVANVAIQGSSMDSVFLSGKLLVRSAAVVKISDLSVANRTDRDAPAIRVIDSSPMFDHLFVSSVNLSCCVVDSGSPKFSNCSFTDTQQHGLWWKSDGNGRCEKCTFSDAGQCNALVEKGEVTFLDCDFARAKCNGVSVRGENSAVKLERCAVHDNGQSNVDVQREGSMSLRSCSVYRSEKCGLYLGSGGQISCIDSKVFENKLPNVFVLAGGRCLLERSKVLCGLQHGIIVKSGGSVRLRNSTVSGNCLDNIVAEEGAVVDL